MNRAIPLRALLLAALLVAPAAARAQELDIEAEHRRGVALRDEHRDAEALEVFRALYERTQEPRALARMALAEAALGAWDVAEEHLRAAMRDHRDRWVHHNRRGLREQLEIIRAHPRTPPVTPPVTPPSGETTVAVDTQTTVTAPPVEAPAPTAATVPAEAPPPTGATVDAVTTVAAPATAVNFDGGAPRGAMLRGLGIAGLVLGAVGLGAGATALLLGNSAASDWSADGCGYTRRADGSYCVDLQGTHGTMATVAPVGFIAGGLLAAGGVALLIAAPSPVARRTAQASRRWACAPGGASSVVCAVEF